MDYGYGHGAQWGGYHGDDLASHFHGYPELGELRGFGFLKKMKGRFGGMMSKFKNMMGGGGGCSSGGGGKWSDIAPKIQDIQGRITGGLKSIADASGNK